MYIKAISANSFCNFIVFVEPDLSQSATAVGQLNFVDFSLQFREINVFETTFITSKCSFFSVQQIEIESASSPFPVRVDLIVDSCNFELRKSYRSLLSSLCKTTWARKLKSDILIVCMCWYEMICWWEVNELYSKLFGLKIRNSSRQTFN